MRILLVTEFFPEAGKKRFTGGVEARTFYTARHLAEKHQLMVICRRTKGLDSKEERDGITVYPCGFPAGRVETSLGSIIGRLFYIAAALKQGLSLDFDLVEGSNFVSYLPALVVGKLKQRPTVAWFADVLKKKWLGFGLAGLTGWLVEWLALRLNWDRLIALSQATKKKLVENGVKRERVKVVYGGVDLAELRNPEAEPDDQGGLDDQGGFDDQGELNDKSRRILCVSRLVKYKRVDDLLKAFKGLLKKQAELSSTKSGLSLTIVGRGPEESRLTQLAGELGIGDKVRFLGAVSRKRLIELFRQADIFCLASVVEGFGLVTIEAAASRTPFVISDIMVNREITNNGRGGLLFKKGNIDDLQKKLAQLIDDQSLYQQKQQEAVELAEKYEWSKQAEETLKVYQQARKDKYGR